MLVCHPLDANKLSKLQMPTEAKAFCPGGLSYS